MAAFDVRATAIEGCLLVGLPRFEDARGSLVKTVQASVFSELGLPGGWVEQFHSHSARGVLRGLHFQTPPAALAKLVVCVAGEAWDAVVDLRVGSATYGEHVSAGLSGEDPTAVLVPEGCAHGFLATAPDTVMMYWTTAEHAPAYDAGIRWDSAGVDWPLDAPPLLSPRDAGLPPLSEYASPFRSAP